MRGASLRAPSLKGSAMNSRNWTISTIAAIGLMFAAASAQAQSLKVDPVHSTIIFRISHLNAGVVYGRFNDPTGTITLGDNPSLNVEVKTDNIDTHNQKRDDHLRSPDFFNNKEFPTISFKSTSFKSSGENKYEVTGDLTLHGVTKPVTVTLEKLGTGKDPSGGTRVGFETIFTIKRSDFGMNFMPGGVGDEVKLMVALETVQQ
jgi:polyisoprenoid-binding protein YceI